MSLEASWSLENWGAPRNNATPGSAHDAPAPSPSMVDVDDAKLQLIDFITYLKDFEGLSARSVCILCWWIHKSTHDNIESVASLAMAPGKQSGKYSLHYDTVVSKGRPTDRNWYRVGAPIFRKCIGERCVSDIACLPPHEAVSTCIAKHGATIIPKLKQARDNLKLPQYYYTHPVVLRNSGGLVFAFGVYIDGVDFTRQDSEVGIWLWGIYSGQRWCVVVLRVSQLANAVAQAIARFTHFGSCCDGRSYILLAAPFLRANTTMGSSTTMVANSWLAHHWA